MDIVPIGRTWNPMFEMPEEVLAPPPEAWGVWLEAHDHEPGLGTVVATIAEATGIPASAILATLYVESKLKHTHPDGSLIYGDGGRSLGIGQVQRTPWEDYCAKQWGAPIDLTLLGDNVLACALVLEYCGYSEDPLKAFAKYNGGTNPNYTYGRLVMALQREIEGWAA